MNGIIVTRVKLAGLFLVGLLACTASGAVAQEAAIDRLRASFPAETASLIEEVAATARARGIPDGPILDKALEGAAKRVPPERVVAAVRVYAERLGDARQALGPRRSAGELVAGAGALSRGVPADVIRRLATERPADIAVPLVVLGDLVGLGVPVDGAYETVDGALDRSSQAHQLLAVPAVVQRLIREGRPPAEAAREITMTFARGVLPAGIPGPLPPGMQLPSGAPVPPGAGPPEGAGKGEDGPPVDPPGPPPPP